MGTTERIVLWGVGILILGLVLWSAFFKPTDNSKYLAGSHPKETHDNNWPLGKVFDDWSFSCVPSGQEHRYDKNLAPITNSNKS